MFRDMNINVALIWCDSFRNFAWPSVVVHVHNVYLYGFEIAPSGCESHITRHLLCWASGGHAANRLMSFTWASHIATSVLKGH